MKSASFTHHQPTSLAHAVQLLGLHAPMGGRILAGGQSLVPMMAFRLATPAHLIDINEIPGLDHLAVAEDTLQIGALVRHAALARAATPALVQAGALGRLLAMVGRHVAHHPIRTRGTFCGSLAHADPASEWCLVATALGATLQIAGPAGARSLPASGFFHSIMTTALAEDEMLVGAALPLLPATTRFGFIEFSRRPGDYALAMALVAWQELAGRIAGPVVAVGGVEPHARRLPQAEAMLEGAIPGAEVFAAAADAAASALAPMEDPQVGAEFRRDLGRVVVQRALHQAAGMAA